MNSNFLLFEWAAMQIHANYMEFIVIINVLIITSVVVYAEITLHSEHCLFGKNCKHPSTVSFYTWDTPLLKASSVLLASMKPHYE